MRGLHVVALADWTGSAVALADWTGSVAVGVATGIGSLSS